MNYKENYLRAVNFERPDYIPVSFHINPACYDYYDNDILFALMEKHKLLFPNFDKNDFIKFKLSNCCVKDRPYLDDFGCLWKTTCDGIVGTVIEHPLEDLSKYKEYKFPNPEICMGIGEINWLEIEQQFKNSPKQLHRAGLRHGHTFLQLCDIRGYQNLMFDMMDEEPIIFDIIAKIEEFNMHIVNKYVGFNVDVMCYAEDLGMQIGPMISPDLFRKYILPSYQRLIKPARDKGIKIHMHSDGDIRTLVDDIIFAGVDIINLQDQVNGIDWIANKFKDSTCVDLDIDRQNLSLFGSEKEIDNHIRNAVSKIGTKHGGLMMVYGLYPGVPIENIEYLMDAIERYMTYYS